MEIFKKLNFPNNEKLQSNNTSAFKFYNSRKYNLKNESMQIGKFNPSRFSGYKVITPTSTVHTQ